MCYDQLLIPSSIISRLLLGRRRRLLLLLQDKLSSVLILGLNGIFEAEKETKRITE